MADYLKDEQDREERRGIPTQTQTKMKKNGKLLI